MRDISGSGIVIVADGTVDLEKLEAEMESTELAKDLLISGPRRRTPEIVVFGVDRNLSDADIIPAILEQNEFFQVDSLELRTSFKGKRGRNFVLAVDESSYERLAGIRKLCVSWFQADFQSN